MSAREPGPARDRSVVRRLVAVGLAVLLLVVAGVAVAVSLSQRGPAGKAGPPVAGDAPGDAPSADPTAGDGGRPVATATPSPTPTDAALTVVAAGDVLPHLAVLESARTPSGHDFGPLLAPLDRWVGGADLALCHLEVPVAPPGSNPSGYPSFGAPTELVDALRAQGWDGCSTASNHALDRGPAGLDATLAALDGAGLGHAGTGRTPAEALRPQVYRLDRAGQTVTVAHLAASYAVNGRSDRAGPGWAVAPLDVTAIVDAATAAREAGADVVLVSVHCCLEYQAAPTAEQERVAAALASSGVVDLVIGHHAHVPQPVVRLPGGPGGEGMWVLHGLGNMLSNQDAECCVPETSSGLLATADVVKPPGGPARVTGVGWTGLTVDRHGGHRVHALPDVAGGTPTLPAGEVAARAERVAAAAGTQAPPRTDPPTPTGPAPTVVPGAG